MIDLKKYEPAYSSAEALELVKSVREEEMIPRDGATELFYKMASYPGESFFINADKKVELFYADTDDFINEIKDQTPGWALEADENLVRIILLYREMENVIPLNFIFDISKELYRDSLRLLMAGEEFSLTMLSMLYGGLIVDSRHLYKIPDHIKSELQGI